MERSNDEVVFSGANQKKTAFQNNQTKSTTSFDRYQAQTGISDQVKTLFKSGDNSAASQNYVMKAKHAVQLSLLDLKGGIGR
jgi:hypothetical protein